MADLQDQQVGQQDEVEDPVDPIPFSLTPGHYHSGVLNFSNKNHIKIYSGATAALDPKFDMEPKNMNLFIDMVKERAAEYHWESTILMIPVIKGATVTGTHNLIDKYGELSIQDVQTQALTWATSDNRSRQDSHMFYTMLRKSLTPEALTVVANMAAQYTIEGHADGPLLFNPRFFMSL